MGREIFKEIMILALFVGLAAGQSIQSFEQCYFGSFLMCILVPPHSAFLCSLQTLRDCLIPKIPMAQSVDNHVHNHSFCELGCASTLCTNISTKQIPGEKKVESCVSSCSSGCSKSYSSP